MSGLRGAVLALRNLATKHRSACASRPLSACLHTGSWISQLDSFSCNQQTVSFGYGLTRQPWRTDQTLHRRSLFSDACSKKYSERRLIRFSQQQLYDVVAEVENYKEFVPWCQRSVIIERKDANNVSAELEVGFKMFVERYPGPHAFSEGVCGIGACLHWMPAFERHCSVVVERYTSEVILQQPTKVVSKVSDSTLFTHLDTTWEFAQGPTPNTCWLSFKTDFMFRSPLYSQVASVFFDEVVKRMMGAFEGRCQQLYGTAPTEPSQQPASSKEKQEKRYQIHEGLYSLL